MTKLQLALTSLIAVIPAAFLIFLLVMVMLTNSENLSTIAYVVMGGTLLSAGATVLIPAGVMFGGNRKAEVAPAKPAANKKRPEIDPDDDLETMDDHVEASGVSSGSFDTQSALDEESAEFDLGDSDQDMLEGDESGIDTEPVEDFEDFDIEEDEEEAKPNPKKKKR